MWIGKLRPREDAARPILQEYETSTVNKLGMHPAESGNLANRITLWKSQKRVGGKRTLAQGLTGIQPQSNLWKWQMLGRCKAEPAGVRRFHSC